MIRFIWYPTCKWLGRFADVITSTTFLDRTCATTDTTDTTATILTTRSYDHNYTRKED